MQQKTNYPSVLFVLAAILSLAGIFVVGISAYRGAEAIEERSLIDRVENLALSIDSREISFLRVDESDVKNPFYISLKQNLEKIRANQNDVRFIYLTGENDKGVFFYADSEPENSSSYSPPGQIYTEASLVFREVFKTGQPRFEGPLSDRWGEWVSAFTPIISPATGKTIAVLGIDINASEYRKRIAFAVITPTLFILLLFFVFVTSYQRYKKEREAIELKSQFISMISYELEPFLSSLAFVVDKLAAREEIRREPVILENINLVKLASVNLSQTIKDMREFIILGNGNLKLNLSRVNLEELISGVISSFKLSARVKDIELVLDNKSTDDCKVYCDREKIRRALSNIIMNAIKYSNFGGSIIAGCQKKEGHCLITISDNGIGIPGKDKDKIFSPYFRAGNADSSNHMGTGLGLYFAKRMIEECLGKIWFESEENIGTTFYITLPIE